MLEIAFGYVEGACMHMRARMHACMHLIAHVKLHAYVHAQMHVQHNTMHIVYVHITGPAGQNLNFKILECGMRAHIHVLVPRYKLLQPPDIRYLRLKKNIS